jgi:intraflagellar transport protein 46
MPSVDSLMQVWPSEIENLLEGADFPGSELDVDLLEYARLGCAVLDIPVREQGELDALHLLFSLYAEFVESQHFGAGTGAHIGQP